MELYKCCKANPNITASINVVKLLDPKVEIINGFRSGECDFRLDLPLLAYLDGLHDTYKLLEYDIPDHISNFLARKHDILGDGPSDLHVNEQRCKYCIYDKYAQMLYRKWPKNSTHIESIGYIRDPDYKYMSDVIFSLAKMRAEKPNLEYLYYIFSNVAFMERLSKDDVILVYKIWINNSEWYQHKINSEMRTDVGCVILNELASRL
jgi:hypothetical protein